MNTVQEIEAAISELPPDELDRLRAWFIEQDASTWDDEFERDASAGLLDPIAREAIEEFRAGKFTTL